MVQCSALYGWRRNCLEFLFHSMVFTDPSHEDGSSTEMLLLPDGHESICPGEGTSWHWPCRTKPPTDSGWLRLTALYQSHYQRNHALGPCCAIRFFRIDNPLFSTWHLNSLRSTPCGDGRWCIWQLLHCKRHQGYCEYLVCPPLTFFANPFLHSTRAITHDEEIYPDPFTFNPNRHLGDAAQPDPYKFVFGFGRRACPGMFSLCATQITLRKKKSIVYYRGPSGRNVLISECIEYLDRLQHLKASGWTWSWSRAEAGLDHGTRRNVGP